MNTVTLMGRLTATPELKYTQNNTAVINFCVAEGDKESTQFIDVVAWKSTAEFVSKWFSKGEMIALVGRLTTRTYEDKNGNKRKTTEVVAEHVYFCGSKKDKPVEVAFEETDDYGDLPF